MSPSSIAQGGDCQCGEYAKTRSPAMRYTNKKNGRDMLFSVALLSIYYSMNYVAYVCKYLLSNA